MEQDRVFNVTSSLTSFEILRYFQNNHRSNKIYSCDNVLNKMKNEAYVINHDEYVDIGTQWIALYVNGNTKTYFDSFGVKHIINEIKKFIGDKNITTMFEEYKYTIQ